MKNMALGTHCPDAKPDSITDADLELGPLCAFVSCYLKNILSYYLMGLLCE